MGAPRRTAGAAARLQELDHPPLVAPVTKLAETVAPPRGRRRDDAALSAGGRTTPRPDVPRRADGRSFFGRADGGATDGGGAHRDASPTPTTWPRSPALLAAAKRPVLVLGTDVWADGAEEAARRLVDELGLPGGGQRHGPRPGAGRRPAARHQGPRCGPRPCRPRASSWVRRWTSGSATASFGGKDDAPRAAVVHVADSPDQVRQHVELAASVVGDLGTVLDGVLAGVVRAGARPDRTRWVEQLQDGVERPSSASAELLAGRRRPDPPGADLRRAAAAPGRRLGAHRRRRRLRVVRGQVRRAGGARWLARPRPVRMSRCRPGRGDRRPGGAPVGAGACCCSATGRPACR